MVKEQSLPGVILPNSAWPCSAKDSGKTKALAKELPRNLVRSLQSPLRMSASTFIDNSVFGEKKNSGKKKNDTFPVMGSIPLYISVQSF